MAIVLVWVGLLIVTSIVTLVVMRARTQRVTSLLRWISIVVFIGMAILGYSEIRRLERYLPIEHWPGVPGKVLAAEVVGKLAYEPKITYQYDVNGQIYSGSTDMGVPGFGNKSARMDVAQKIVAANPPGKRVTVHYNPDNVADSRLRISPPWNVFMQISAAIFFSLLSSVVITLALVDWRRRKQAT